MTASPSEPDPAPLVPEAVILAESLGAGEVTVCERDGEGFLCRSYRRSAGIVGGSAEPGDLVTQAFRVREIIIESPVRLAPDATLRTAWLIPPKAPKEARERI